VLRILLCVKEEKKRNMVSYSAGWNGNDGKEAGTTGCKIPVLWERGRRCSILTDAGDDETDTFHPCSCRADFKYFFLVSVRYSVIADGRRSCRSSLSHIFFVSARLATDCICSQFLDNCATLAEASRRFVGDSGAFLFYVIMIAGFL